MRNEFLEKEFLSISNGNDFITIQDFRQKYGRKVIEDSKKVSEILKGIESE